jgi:hypothetical protein
MISVKLGSQVWLCNMDWGVYSNGRFAMVLIDAIGGEPVGRATVNLVDEDLAADEIALNHDFADDLEASLVAAGVIAPHHRLVRPDGSWVDFRICKLLVTP